MPIDIRKWAQEQQQRRAEQNRSGKGVTPGGNGGANSISYGSATASGSIPARQAGETQDESLPTVPGYDNYQDFEDSVMRESWAAIDNRRAEEERKRREEERRSEERRRLDEERRRLAALRVDEIAQDEYDTMLTGARMFRQESDANRRAAEANDAAISAHVDKMAQDEYDNMLTGARMHRQEMDANARAEEADRERRASEFVNQVMDAVYAEQDEIRRTPDVPPWVLAMRERQDNERQYYKEEAAERRAEMSALRTRQANERRLNDLIGTLSPEMLEIFNVLTDADVDFASMSNDEILSMLRDARRQMMRKDLPVMPTRGEYIASRVPEPRMSTGEFADRWADSTEEFVEQRARDRGERTAQRMYDPSNTPYADESDSPYVDWIDVTDVKGDDEKVEEYVMDKAGSINSKAYEILRERDKGGDYTIDDYVRGVGGIDLDPSKDESFHEAVLRHVRNQMLRRFLNPALLRIDGQHINIREEVDKKGKTHRYARIEYSPRVLRAIGRVSQVYDCSIHNVLQLVQLRGGIGIDAKGLIGKVDPDKFKLTEDQFVELCNDIVKSQEKHGHPLGVVDGTPGGSGVRDDSGRYVIVAGTRCFPLGYMPRQLLYDLRKNWHSPLHDMSEMQIQTMIGNSWLQTTYAELLANTRGAQMFQARAIENMMRGLMMVDGMNPSELDIPEIKSRETLMILEAEASECGSEDVQRELERRNESYRESRERTKKRYIKETRRRDENGRLQSVSQKRRRNSVGDLLGWGSMTMRHAKSQRLPILLSSPVEQLRAMAEQNVVMFLTSLYTNNIGIDVDGNYIDSSEYEFTPELMDIANSPETSEALDVSNTLYNIGGWTLIDTFLSDTGDDVGEGGGDGRAKWTLTKEDLNRFLEEWMITSPNPVLPEKIRQALRITPEQEKSFMQNAQGVLMRSENIMLSNGFFDGAKTRTYMRIAMNEMLQARRYGGRASYTSDQVAAWGSGPTGGEEAVRSLLKTDAGREAFMTEGATGLGRKSMVEHAVRQMMSANRVTEFVIRTFFDRFPEYGVQKLISQIPYANTAGFITAKGLQIAGGALVENDNAVVANMGRSMQRASEYQMGIHMTTLEGLRKNLLYDTVMAGSRLGTAFVYCQYILAMGGVYPPEDPEKRNNWSEWCIGKEGEGIPIKWAWWMDDLSGIGLPLGIAMAICEQSGWSQDAKNDATKVFIDAVCNLDKGTVLFDSIDFFNNWEQELDYFLGRNNDDTLMERSWVAIQVSLFNVLGDMTPEYINELCPWSRDYILKTGEDDAHTPYKVYDRGEESKYTAEESYDEYRVKDASPSDVLLRQAAQSNVPMAIILDLSNRMRGRKDATSYKYAQMPLDTLPETYMQNSWYDEFYLDPKELVGMSKDERQAELYQRAQTICDQVENYSSAEDAYADGFILNFEARVNCINYCYHMINEAYDQFDTAVSEAKMATGENYLDQPIYDELKNDREEQVEHWKDLLNTYFNFGNAIPWRVPRYVRQESDTETIYVDDAGNAGTYLGTIDALRNNGALRHNLLTNGPFNGWWGWGEAINQAIGDSKTHEKKYGYGNVGGLSPTTTPITKGKGYDDETIPPWVFLDEDGKQINDTSGIYERMGELPAVEMGTFKGSDLQELYYGGHGNNMKDDVKEEMSISPDGTPTMGRRNYRIMDEILPDELAELVKDPALVSNLLGIDSDIPDKDGDGKSSNGKGSSSGSSSSDSSQDNKSGKGKGNKGGNGTTYRRSYSRGYGGGGYKRYYYHGGGGNSEYNPKIYSSSHSVYSTKAAGMSTRQPYRATTSYLRPSFYTSGSRRAYNRLS